MSATSIPRLPPIGKREHLHALLFGVRNKKQTPDEALILIEEWADAYARRAVADYQTRFNAVFPNHNSDGPRKG